ncbi:MAG TPA: hypothetical protein PKI62_13835 [bacterium]|nr:hypothetical protein [bacterium]HPR87782.1 hypothetical protein [bacterium]
MKKEIAVLVLLAAGGLLASPQKMERTDMAVQGYVQALASDVDGLKHDAIFHVACLKTQQPAADLGACEKALEKIAKRAGDLRIRLHAQLTLAYLRDDRLAERIKVTSLDDPAAFFGALYREVSISEVASR